jgi:hypothetical protein
MFGGIYHPLGKIDAEYMPARTDRPSRRKGDEPGAAGDIQYAFARCRRRQCQQGGVGGG